MVGHHQIVIIGGGTAGITVAASLRNHDHDDALDIAIIEPSKDHYYQPAFTLVGGGAETLAKTRRDEASLIPDDVKWIQDSAASIDPDTNKVGLSKGGEVTYDFLVVCPGLVMNWGAIEGFKDAVGTNGVCCNYSPDTVEYTWETLKAFLRGGTALFAQPAMPIKCPGAPQKIAYLTADYLRRGGILKDCHVHFLPQGPSMFSVPYFAAELNKVADSYGIHKHFQHSLTKVDAANKRATFAVVGGDNEGQTVEMEFDMLHAVPPQHAPDVVRKSALANDGGWIDVNQHSMQSTKYPNVFGLGDACSTPNSKTAAAVRKQAPVVVKNLNALINSGEVDKDYDGYGSCPLTTAYGKVMMAEFTYGGKVTPTLPLNPSKERRINWWIKKTGLPLFYWKYMLKGHEAFPRHNTNFEG
ncbi:MAG: FAD/NAD(P)-binding oxidoreductase [Rhodospirillaceae bacterium]|jgi:sulfide:quinone oxidoreductase|nr:FAD/NAD(P)-binding oxidoreductase [Rhodospirillaceae bacterium]